MYELGNSQCRNILSHTSYNQRLVSVKGIPKVSTGGPSPIFFRKLGETYKQPLHFKHTEKVPDYLSVSACSEIFSSTYFNDLLGKSFK